MLRAQCNSYLCGKKVLIAAARRAIFAMFVIVVLEKNGPKS